ncbi:MAG: glycosyltransferase family 4 protein [Primorskyibacter sp.]
MKIAWVTRSFLDYRVPVFRDVDALTGGQMTLSFSGDYVPAPVTAKAVDLLGDRAFPLSGETKLGSEDRQHMANKNFSFRWQPGLVKHIRSLNPDVLVCDGFFKWTLPAVLYRMRYGTPLVIAYERTRHTERKAQAVRRIYRKGVVRVTDAMVCSGQLCLDYSVADLGMDAARVTTGHMTADTDGLRMAAAAVSDADRAALRDRLGLRGVVFLYVGRLLELKGMREMIAAWRQAGFAPDEASLLIVGDGPLRDDLRASTQDMPNVHFTGAIPYDDLAPYYAVADSFVIATLEDNWSLVVPEAMACGLPVLSSVYNGCWPEMVRPENGWTFTPQAVSEFAGVLRAAQGKGRDGLAAMGQASRAIVAQYGPDHAARSIVEACDRAIAHRKR